MNRQWIFAVFMTFTGWCIFAVSDLYKPLPAAAQISETESSYETMTEEPVLTAQKTTSGLIPDAEDEVYQPSLEELNLAYCFPEGEDTNDIMKSYAGKAYMELMAQDEVWMGGIYDYADLMPEQLAALMGQPRSRVLGNYNPKDDLHDPSDPNTWAIHSFRDIRMHVANGDQERIEVYSNVAEIMSMANVYTYYKGVEDFELFLSYARDLWEASHSYSIRMSDIYYCDGCLDEEDEEKRLKRDAEAEDEDIKKAAKAAGQNYPAGMRNKKSGPGLETEKENIGPAGDATGTKTEISSASSGGAYMYSWERQESQSFGQADETTQALEHTSEKEKLAGQEIGQETHTETKSGQETEVSEQVDSQTGQETGQSNQGNPQTRQVTGQSSLINPQTGQETRQSSQTNPQTGQETRQSSQASLQAGQEMASSQQTTEQISQNVTLENEMEQPVSIMENEEPDETTQIIRQASEEAASEQTQTIMKKTETESIETQSIAEETELQTSDASDAVAVEDTQSTQADFQEPWIEETTPANTSELSKCPGHIDLIIQMQIRGLKEKNSLFRKDPNGNNPANFEENGWQGWSQEDTEAAIRLSSQNWFEKYGLSVSLIPARNPLTQFEIEEYMNRLPEGLSQTRRDLIRFALSSVGKVPYYWGGKPSAPNYSRNSFGAIIAPDKRGRILKGLDCSGWISWVYWSVTGQRLPYESTSGLALCGKSISREQLQPGDIIIRTGEDAHVIMFLEWTEDGKICCIHESSAGDNNVTVAVRDANWPYYRKLID